MSLVYVAFVTFLILRVNFFTQFTTICEIRDVGVKM